MREIIPDPGGHRFLLKAISEAGNELAEELFGCPRRLSDVLDADGWSLRLIAAHVLAYEEMVAGYLDLILSERLPGLDVVDTEAVRDDPDACRDDPDESVLSFAHVRRRTQYLLWDLHDRHWRRVGRHPYRGEITVLQLARELHLHDIEYLWRARRLKESAGATRGGGSR